MQIQNNTPHILVFGKAVIEPSRTGTLPPEFDGHPSVDLLIRLKKIRPLKPFTEALPVQATNYQSVKPTSRPAPPPSVHTSDLDPSNDGPEVLSFDSNDIDIPIGWDEFHGNKCRAWIKKCDDIVLLGKMHAIELRPKIRVALQARIDTLMED